MKAAYETLAPLWEQLAGLAYNEAMSLGEDREAIVEVFTRFRDAEDKLLSENGWTYDEFKEQTLARAGGTSVEG